MVFHYFISILIIVCYLVKQSFTLSIGLLFSRYNSSLDISAFAEAILMPIEYFIDISSIINNKSTLGEQLGLIYEGNYFYCNSTNRNNQISVSIQV